MVRKWFNQTDPAINKGSKHRGGAFGPAFGSKEHGMIGTLHSALFHQDRYLLNCVEVKVKLSTGKPGFFSYVQ